jgi:hypothetical protein
MGWKRGQQMRSRQIGGSLRCSADLTSVVSQRGREGLPTSSVSGLRLMAAERSAGGSGYLDALLSVRGTGYHGNSYEKAGVCQQ